MFPRLQGTTCASLRDRLDDKDVKKASRCRTRLHCVAALALLFLLCPFILLITELVSRETLNRVSFIPLTLLPYCLLCWAALDNMSDSTLDIFGALGQQDFLGAIRRSLPDRPASVSQDRFFSLYGVLARFGYTTPVPDYTQDTIEVATTFLSILFGPEPRNFALLVDASLVNARVGGPSWVLDWS